MFNNNLTISLIQALECEKKALLNDFYSYIKYDNLNYSKKFLISITPLKFKENNFNKDYFDLFFELSSQLDFVSNFNLKKALLIFMEIQNIEKSQLIFETLFPEIR